MIFSNARFMQAETTRGERKKKGGGGEFSFSNYVAIRLRSEERTAASYVTYHLNAERRSFERWHSDQKIYPLHRAPRSHSRRLLMPRLCKLLNIRRHARSANLKFSISIVVVDFLHGVTTAFPRPRLISPGAEQPIDRSRSLFLSPRLESTSVIIQRNGIQGLLRIIHILRIYLLLGCTARGNASG